MEIVKKIIAIAFVALLIPTKVAAENTQPPVVAKSVKVNWAYIELISQLKNPKVPSMKYWYAIAQCETRNNWQNRGRWAGGLGIMNAGTAKSKGRGTWERWGGEQYAPSPDKATRLEQIVIANRIAVLGYQTKDSYRTWDDKVNNRPMFKHPVGFYGWGCAANIVGNPQGVLKNGHKGSYKKLLQSRK